MNELVDKINERKQKINDLCMELRWVYRGYFASIYEYLPRRSILASTRQLAEQLVAYNKDLEDNEIKLYTEFIFSSIVFLKKYCRPSDMVFLSIYKMALVIEKSWKQGKAFEDSIFRYMFEPHEKDDDVSKEYTALRSSISSFGEMYDSPNYDKEDFPYHITLMIDCFLFENNQSYLLDCNHEDGIRKLQQQIGTAKYQLYRSLQEVDADE